MSNKQQTAVEWLETQIRDLIPNDIGSQLKFKNKIKQAKEMDKEQKINDFKHAQFLHAIGDETRAEQYYYEIYGGGEQ
jgi:hypothetical protein